MTQAAAVQADRLNIPITEGNRFGHNDARDAFRHAYSSALETRNLGSDSGELVGEINEAYHPNDADEAAMDRWNNMDLFCNETDPQIYLLCYSFTISEV